MELEFEQGFRQEILDYLDSLHMNLHSNCIHDTYFTAVGGTGDTIIKVRPFHRYEKGKRGEEGKSFGKLTLLNVDVDLIENLEKIVKSRAVLTT